MEGEGFSSDGLSRREFFIRSAAAGAAAGAVGAPGGAAGAAHDPAAGPDAIPPPGGSWMPEPMRAPRVDLSPARWLWYPSERCLANTFVLFRREIDIPFEPATARCLISADSRYLLSVNGSRVRWGSAPADPRWPDADPIDLGGRLRKGPNVIGATVLHYGHGEGTWPAGKPGFIFLLEISSADGQKLVVASDGTWQAHLARAWKPGQYRRWYLRALQEEFDARLYPFGWDRPGFAADGRWLGAMVLDCPGDRPSICSNFPDYALDAGGDRRIAFLRQRQIPALREEEVPAVRLAESFWMRWKRDPAEYFECKTPGSFDVERTASAREAGAGAWRVGSTAERAAALVFEFTEQMVGWPYFTIDAPAGTVVEVLWQEAHAVGGPALLDTHFYNWSRFTCREGENRFEAFDYESLRWLQLHIRGAAREVTVRAVGLRRRIFPWPRVPEIRTGEPALDRLFGAAVNTLNNSAQETCVDGMGRERQQYSGDGGHQLHSISQAFGETRLQARFIRTFSEGMTIDGYFMDCWPAYDRLARILERQLGLTMWGPILDHGIGFNFDCWYHLLYTGDVEALREPWPRLVRFAGYLAGIRRNDGLLPVEDIGVPSVWLDHQAYLRPRHKRCAFNLYAAAMLRHAFAPMARALGDAGRAAWAEDFARGLLEAAVGAFWDAQGGLFVNNLPWAPEEGGIRLCDRSLATAILFDQCPGGRTAAGLKALVECPPEMGFSYPCNAGWRLWALARGGRADVVVDDLRKRWAPMASVLLNNTIQEDWTAAPDTGSQWSHCAVVPLYVAHMDLAGIRPVEPGFQKVEIRPQLGDLQELTLTTHTVRGPIRFAATGTPQRRKIALAVPQGMEAVLLFPREWKVSLDRLPGEHPLGLLRYGIPAGRLVEFEAVLGA